MKLDFNFDLVGLDGEVVRDLKDQTVNAGKVLANALAQGSKGDALKFWDWAVNLNKGEILDLDSSDQETIKNFIKDSEGFTILAKAQLLQVLKKD
jgi:hypothetical protein